MSKLIRAVAAIASACAAGCRTEHCGEPIGPETVARAKVVKLTDKERIRVIVCEYLVTNAFHRPGNKPVFAFLEDHERQALRSRPVGYRIEPAEFGENLRGLAVRDKMSKKPGVFIGVPRLSIDLPTTAATGALSLSEESVFYSFKLRKFSDWTIENVSQTR